MTELQLETPARCGPTDRTWRGRESARSCGAIARSYSVSLDGDLQQERRRALAEPRDDVVERRVEGVLIGDCDRLAAEAARDRGDVDVERRPRGRAAVPRGELVHDPVAAVLQDDVERTR